MKKLVGMIMSVMLINTAHAGDMPNIHIMVSGAAHDSSSYICVSHMDCINLAATSHMNTVPMGPGSINNIDILDAAQHRIYAQALPASCQVTVNSNQTLTVSGHAVNGGTHINNLHCSLS